MAGGEPGPGAHNEVSGGQTLAMVGGDIGITSLFSAPQLSAPGGRIPLVSVASGGAVVFDPTGRDPSLQVHALACLEEIALQNARLDGDGNGGGTMVSRVAV